jgi:hypothetical protein
VLATTVNKEPVYKLQLHGQKEGGQQDELGVSAEHPFWVKGKGWTAAAELKSDSEVQNAHGEWLQVGSLEPQLDEQTTYNLSVEGSHSFFVGQSQAWVHNTCPLSFVEESLSASSKAADYQAGTTGARSNIFSRKLEVPALTYNNPNPRGRSFVKFDGIESDGVTLIDRKLNITSKSKQLRDLGRVSDVIAQNPGYSLFLEVPKQSVANRAIKILDKLGITNIGVRVR